MITITLYDPADIVKACSFFLRGDCCGNWRHCCCRCQLHLMMIVMMNDDGYNADVNDADDLVLPHEEE